MSSALKAEVRTEIARALTVICEPGAVHEVRIPKTGRTRTVAGYFDDPEKLAVAVEEWDGRAPGVYITLNPVAPALLARAHNRVQENAELTTADKDIVKRRWMLVDCDPVRPAGISSTDGEKAAAHEVALQVRDYLLSCGWPPMILADSGNGWHLLIRVDLPNDNEATNVIKGCLRALGEKFSTKVVSIDLTVFNAARIVKLYGTVAAKGDRTENRPHRRARIVEVPDTLLPCERELLEALAAVVETLRPPANASAGEFEIAGWLQVHGVAVRRVEEYNGGHRWILEACPFNEDHAKGTDTAVIQLASGALVFKCQHHGCADKKWQDFRTFYEPDHTPMTPGPHGDGASPGHQDPSESLAQLHCLTTASTPTELTAAIRSFGEAVNRLDPIAREVARDHAVQCLTGIGVKSPARMIDAALPKPKTPDAPAEAGSTLTLSDPDPWPEPVRGEELLGALVKIIRRFIVMDPEHAVAAALWTLFTFPHDAFTISPLLAVSSPEKRCGKTRLLELLGALVRRPLFTSNITPAAVFRSVEAFNPTLILDEAETYIRGDNEDLRGILNSGHSKATAYVVRTVGEEHEAHLFKTFCPKVVALIGNLPSTIEDRSIVIQLRRKTPSEGVEHLRADRLEEFASLRSQAARWAEDNAPFLTGADPRVPAEIQSDRARDNWRPLLAIADAVGGLWPERARAASVVLSGVEAAAESAGVTLLEDLRDVFTAQGTERLSSEVIVEALVKMEERPWPEWNKGRPISARGVARLLKPFGVEPDKWKDRDGKTVRGYNLSDFKDAFSRYTGGSQAPPAPPDSKQSTYTDTISATEPPLVADDVPRNSFTRKTVADVALAEGGYGVETPPTSAIGGDAGLGFDEVEV